RFTKKGVLEGLHQKIGRLNLIRASPTNPFLAEPRPRAGVLFEPAHYIRASPAWKRRSVHCGEATRAQFCGSITSATPWTWTRPSRNSKPSNTKRIAPQYKR